MTTKQPFRSVEGPPPTRERLLGPESGEIRGAIESVRDRFLLHGRDTGGRFALVEHLMPPKTLAAPLHRHSREDEYSFILEGRVGAVFGSEEVFGVAGDLILKPRGEWHTFWNAGEEPARVLEIISPGGFEAAFEEMHDLGEELDPVAMAAIASRYGTEVDFESTYPLLERHGLRF